jgi:transcriptional regulator with XRE-family HTH domain
MLMNTVKARQPTKLDALIGQRIRQARTLRNLSQAELATKAGVTFQQLQKYENGSNRVSASRLYQIAKILEFPVTYFFGEQDLVPKKMEWALDEDSAEVLVRFHPLSKPKRKIVRELLVQLGKAA